MARRGRGWARVHRGPVPAEDRAAGPVAAGDHRGRRRSRTGRRRSLPALMGGALGACLVAGMGLGRRSRRQGPVGGRRALFPVGDRARHTSDPARAGARPVACLVAGTARRRSRSAQVGGGAGVGRPRSRDRASAVAATPLGGLQEAAAPAKVPRGAAADQADGRRSRAAGRRVPPTPDPVRPCIPATVTAAVARAAGPAAQVPRASGRRDRTAVGRGAVRAPDGPGREGPADGSRSVDRRPSSGSSRRTRPSCSRIPSTRVEVRDLRVAPASMPLPVNIRVTRR